MNCAVAEPSAKRVKDDALFGAFDGDSSMGPACIVSPCIRAYCLTCVLLQGLKSSFNISQVRMAASRSVYENTHKHSPDSFSETSLHYRRSCESLSKANLSSRERHWIRYAPLLAYTNTTLRYFTRLFLSSDSGSKVPWHGLCSS